MFDKIVSLSFAGCLPYFFRSSSILSVCDILPDRTMKEKCLLGDIPDKLTQNILRHPLDILTIDENPSGLGIKKSEKKFGKSAFSGPRRTDQANFLSWLYRQGKILEDC